MRLCEICQNEPAEYAIILPDETMPGQKTPVCRFCIKEIDHEKNHPHPAGKPVLPDS